LRQDLALLTSIRGSYRAYNCEGDEPENIGRMRGEELVMSAPFMIQSANGVLTIDISNAIYAEGTAMVANLPADSGPGQIQPSQGWQAVPDPLGSGHYLIVSGACTLCIGIGTNVPLGADATDDATDRGAVLTLQAQEQINNRYQLWDFLPPSSGAGNTAFIQSPQTGYVIELQSQSTEECNLIVNPRRISNETYQLWTAVDHNGNPVAFPVVSMAQLGAPLRGSSQYVLLPSNQADHLTGITITLDIIEDVVVDGDGYSIQINCNTPWVGPDGFDTEDYDRDAQWTQFGLFMQNDTLVLFNQTWHRLGGVLASEFPSVTETSAPLLQLQANTIPAGTRILLNLCTDQDDFAIGIAGLALDITGLPIGTPIYWPAIGRDSFHPTDGGKVHQKAMAPVGAFQVVFCSLPGNPGAQFTSGMGTITVTASPGIAAQNYAYNPHGLGTAENSNMPYDLVPTGTARLIAQPFGVPTPPIHPPVHIPGVGTGLEKTVIILEPGGLVEILPGDAPGAPIVINEQGGARA
jgi:hypothetical protein